MLPTFSPSDAEVLFGLLSSVLIPFVVSFFSKRSMRPIFKFAFALALALVGALLTEYQAGHLAAGSVTVAFVGIFMATQAHFASWFKGLELDDALLDIGVIDHA